MTRALEQQTQRRQLQGVVVSDKMQKTVVVRVDRRKRHPKYHKYFVVSKRFLVHDEAGVARKGDTVEFEECRPISRHKRWRIIESNW
ncbi:30S ribosomal protein S17 [Candidatus Uhrbacteria bacterium]|nr:30S ribosomal protein S17 [Candidatus Uhrbacteria bacterium]